MSSELKPVVVGIGVGLALVVIVGNAAAAAGVPERWLGSLYWLCGSIGVFIGLRMVFKQLDHADH